MSASLTTMCAINATSRWHSLAKRSSNVLLSCNPPPHSWLRSSARILCQHASVERYPNLTEVERFVLLPSLNAVVVLRCPEFQMQYPDARASSSRHTHHTAIFNQGKHWSTRNLYNNVHLVSVRADMFAHWKSTGDLRLTCWQLQILRSPRSRFV